MLDKEGTDIYAHIRRPELQQIQNIADNLLNAEKRVHLSDILKSMDNATLNQLEKDLAGEGGEALRALFGEKVGCVRAWGFYKIKGIDDLATNVNALEYFDELETGAKFGNDGITDFNQLKWKWDELFPSTVNPDGTSKLVRHHAVEQQVLNKYPGVLTDIEMQSISNLRGIPKDINPDIHLSKIRIEWIDFYRQFDNSGTIPTKQQLLEKATEIDQMFGHYFIPPLK
ncbi:MAG: hypothetical protein KBF75_12225 [Saprospiraceae bacterium]|nr:hypothetical protein [Saprospiraceae bacterium]